MYIIYSIKTAVFLASNNTQLFKPLQREAHLKDILKSILTTQKKHPVYIMKISCLIIFKKTVGVCSENQMKYINILCVKLHIT